MQILDGKLVAQAVKNDLKIKVDALKEKGKKTPHLAAVLVGNNGASETYVASKVKTCEEIGYQSTLIRFNADVEEDVLLRKIQELNADDNCRRKGDQHDCGRKGCGWFSSCQYW